MFFSSLNNDHMKGTINNEQTDRHTKTKNTRQKQRASHGPKLPPGKRQTIPLQPRSKAVVSLLSLRVELFVLFAVFILVFGFVALLLEDGV